MKNIKVFICFISLVIFAFSLITKKVVAEDGVGILSGIVLDKKEFESREFHKDALKDAREKIVEAVGKNERKKLEMENALVETMGKEIVKDKNKLKDAITAPLGLYWGYGYDDLISMGVELTSTENNNIYLAKKLPAPLKDFSDVRLDLFDDNKLWQIYLTGKFNKKDADGKIALKDYKKYKSLLEKKYGVGKEFFQTTEREIPLSKEEISKLVEEAGGDKKVKEKNIFIPTTKKIKEEIGGPNFVKDIASGNAGLYVVFDTEMLNIQLGLEAISAELTYLTITYRSKVISELRDKETLEVL